MLFSPSRSPGHDPDKGHDPGLDQHQNQHQHQDQQDQYAPTPIQSSAGPSPEKTAGELATSDDSITSDLEKWNQPTVNRGRYLATVFGLAVMGMNDACIGALIPYVRFHVHQPHSQAVTMTYLNDPIRPVLADRRPLATTD